MLWPKCARLFSYLWHGTIDSHQAEELLDYSQFLDCHATLPSFLFNNLVIVKPDPISLAWQELLLSKPITITLDRGFENLFVAAIKENRDRQINLKSPFKELVLDLKDRIFPIPKRPVFYRPARLRDAALMATLTSKQQAEERVKRESRNTE